MRECRRQTDRQRNSLCWMETGNLNKLFLSPNYQERIRIAMMRRRKTVKMKKRRKMMMMTMMARMRKKKIRDAMTSDNERL